MNPFGIAGQAPLDVAAINAWNAEIVRARRLRARQKEAS